MTKTTNHYLAATLFATAALSSLAGCNKDSGEKPAAPIAEVKSSVKAETSSAIGVYVRESLQPIANYIATEYGFEGGDGISGLPTQEETFRDMYWSKANRDNALLAFDFLPAYRMEPDTFKRSDLLKANSAQLDTLFDSKKDKNHFRLELGNSAKGVSVDKYDPKLKGFPVHLMWKDSTETRVEKPEDARKDSIQQWVIRTLGTYTQENADEKKVVYKPKTEDEARSIEAKLVNGDDYLPGTILGHVVKSFPSNLTHGHTIVFVADGVIVRTKGKREPLFMIDSEQLGREVTVQEESTRRLLDLPEVPPAPGFRRAGGGF